MRRGLVAGVAVAASMMLSGCNSAPSSARLLGFVVDGLTAAKLDLFPKSGSLSNLGSDANSHDQVYSIVGGSYKRATACGQGDINASNLVSAAGCYRFEGLPVNTPLPVFAQYDGYAPFLSSVQFTVNAPQGGGNISLPYTIGPNPDPQLIEDIRLFPVGFGIDYTFSVVYSNSRPVPNATITCQRTVSTDAYATPVTSAFLTPDSSLEATVSATTGTDGTAKIAGSGLVNGASYSCKVYGTFEGHTVSNTSYAFNAGLDAADRRIIVNDLATGNNNNTAALFAVGSNVDDPAALVGASGSLVITLNAPADIVAGSEDCQESVLPATPDTNGNGNYATLTPNVTGNGVSETASASVSSDGLTVTLAYKGLTGLDTGDLGTTISFAGIFLRPRNTVDQGAIYTVTGAGLSPYGTGTATCTALGNAYGAPIALTNERTTAAQSGKITLF